MAPGTDTLIAKFVEQLAAKGASETDRIHAQSIAVAIIKIKATSSLVCEVDKNSIQLTFHLPMSDGTNLGLDSIISEVSKPINGVSAASLRFNPREACAIISAVLIRNQQPRERDRDQGAVIVFRNKINDIMKEAALVGRHLVAAQLIQKYMINIHVDQPVTEFAVINDSPPVMVIVSGIDVVSLFVFNEIKKNKDITSIYISASCTTNLSPPKYEIVFHLSDDSNPEASSSFSSSSSSHSTKDANLSQSRNRSSLFY